MGARGRRTGRRLRQATSLPADLSVTHHRLVVPSLAVAYGLLLAAFGFGLDQLAVIQSEGPWLEVIGAAVLGGSLLTAGIFAATAWRRRREGLRRRAMAWAAAATLSGLVGSLAVLFVVSAIQVSQLLNGADVHLTRPVLESLPRPADATPVAERPGAAGTESAYQDLKTNHLEQVPGFYRSALAEVGWTEESSSVEGLLRFRQGDFVTTVLLATIGGARSGPGQYTVTVDRIPEQRPSPSQVPSPSP
jgi:hypothetical protein